MYMLFSLSDIQFLNGDVRTTFSSTCMSLYSANEIVCCLCLANLTPDELHTFKLRKDRYRHIKSVDKAYRNMARMYTQMQTSGKGDIVAHNKGVGQKDKVRSGKPDTRRPEKQQPQTSTATDRVNDSMAKMVELLGLLTDEMRDVQNRLSALERGQRKILKKLDKQGKH